MALFDLHEGLITALAVALIAACLSLQSLPTDRVAYDPTAVCEKPGLSAFGLALVLH